MLGFWALYKRGSSPLSSNCWIHLQNTFLLPPLKSFEKTLLYFAKTQDLWSKLVLNTCEIWMICSIAKSTPSFCYSIVPFDFVSHPLCVREYSILVLVLKLVDRTGFVTVQRGAGDPRSRRWCRTSLHRASIFHFIEQSLNFIYLLYLKNWLWRFRIACELFCLCLWIARLLLELLN